MSGKELFDFIYSLGYSEYCLDVGLQDSLKPSAKGLDWLFALPKVSRLLNWILKEMPKSQLVHYKDLKSYQNLALKVSHERVKEIEDLLTPESFEVSDQEDIEAVNKELETLISEQESQIKTLEKLLEEEQKVDLDLTKEEKELESINQELEHDILQYLERFSEICPAVPLVSVQNYLKIDEEVTQGLANYCKMIDLCVGAIDGSVFQRCLMSDRGSEFTALCFEKRVLEETSLETYFQMLLASAALEKTRSALKTYEKSLTSHSSNEKNNLETVLISKQVELEEVDKTLINTLNSLEQVKLKLNEINAHDLQYENLEISLKKKDFASLKQAEIQKMIKAQKGFNLLALASIITEMKKIQTEYDKIFNIQSFFEEILAQTEFRQGYYQKYKIKAEVLSDEMKTIDERNDFFSKIAKLLGIGPRSTFDEVFAALVKAKDLQNFKEKARMENLKGFAAQAKTMIYKLTCIKNEIRENVMTKENIEESDRIVRRIQELEDNLILVVDRFELMNKDVVIGELGFTERDIFVEYLLEKEPIFFNECQF